MVLKDIVEMHQDVLGCTEQINSIYMYHFHTQRIVSAYISHIALTQEC